jgi:hypothetical protein
MADQSYVPPEAKAYAAFLAWLEEGKKVWVTFEHAGVPVPATLKRALTDATQNSTSNKVRRTPARQPDRPEMPPQAHDDWLWVDVKDASLRTIVLAILNEGKLLSIKDVINRVKQIDPQANEGSIYNLGSQEEKIQRTDEGWKLKEGEDAPILYKNYIWAPMDTFQKQDIAAFRRMAVRHLLAISPDGLQIMQVYRQLQDADWLKTPKSKDLIKTDLLIMKADKKVRTMGNSKKWTLNESFN